ncbi:hypothetical protein D3C75_1262450 [compost metagenome]
MVPLGCNQFPYHLHRDQMVISVTFGLNCCFLPPSISYDQVHSAIIPADSYFINLVALIPEK